ncbi:hypothetical protein ACFLTJ_01535 [Chloroflexota bacterium]
MYRMDDGLIVAKKASTDIEAWLRKQKTTIDVKNVEDDPKYQERDIDLIWSTDLTEYTIKVKGDRYLNSPI